LPAFRHEVAPPRAGLSERAAARATGSAGARHRLRWRGLRRRGLLRRLRDLRLADEDLDPAVLRAARLDRVVGDRLARAAAVDRDALGRDAAVGEAVAHARGAVDRERVVDRVVAGAVRVADDPHGRRGIRAKRLREAVEDRPEVRLDVGSSGAERHVARHLELELVVGRLRDRDAGALGRLLHRPLLLLHLLRPHVGATADCGGAARGTGPRATGAVDHAADERAAERAEPGAGRGILLGLVHAGAAGGERDGQGAEGVTVHRNAPGGRHGAAGVARDGPVRAGPFDEGAKDTAGTESERSPINGRRTARRGRASTPHRSGRTVVRRNGVEARAGIEPTYTALQAAA